MAVGPKRTAGSWGASARPMPGTVLKSARQAVTPRLWLGMGLRQDGGKLRDRVRPCDKGTAANVQRDGGRTRPRCSGRASGSPRVQGQFDPVSARGKAGYRNLRDGLHGSRRAGYSRPQVINKKNDSSILAAIREDPWRSHHSVAGSRRYSSHIEAIADRHEISPSIGSPGSWRQSTRPTWDVGLHRGPGRELATLGKVVDRGCAVARRNRKARRPHKRYLKDIARVACCKRLFQASGRPSRRCVPIVRRG